MNCHVPKATHLDVRRIICRDFPPEVIDHVLRKLQSYGSESWHVETDRVHLAVLKIANGDLSEVERNVSIAINDYRDVIAEAEYPEQCKLGFAGMDSTPQPQLMEMEQRDLTQYQEWLKAP